MAYKVIGSDLSGADRTLANNYLCLCQFTAVMTDLVLQIRVSAAGSGNFKAALYTDNSNNPGTLMNSSASVPVVSGINVVPFPSTPIVSGTKYWLAIVSSGASNIINATSTGGTSRYVWLSYENDFPATPSALTNDTFEIQIAGWGGVDYGSVAFLSDYGVL